MSEPNAPTNLAAQRDGQGRFLPNNGGGPGNPFARQVALLRKALIAAVSADDIAAIAEKLKEKALAGDLAAIKVLFGYVLGKPTPMPDPDQVENKEKQEETKLETLLGRIVMPVLRRGWVPVDEEQTEPECITPAATAAVNKPSAAEAPGAQSPASRPAAAAPRMQVADAADGPLALGVPRSPNGAAPAPPRRSPGSATVGRQQTAVPFERLVKEERPFQPGVEQMDLTITGGR
jgi:hypothetical protein